MLVNLTPHAINLVVGSQPLTVPPSGVVARCAVTREVTGSVEVEGVSIPLTRSVFGTVDGLPAPRRGTYYIVSSLVAQACPERSDLVIPDDTVRDERGQIIGCRALARIR